MPDTPLRFGWIDKMLMIVVTGMFIVGTIITFLFSWDARFPPSYWYEMRSVEVEDFVFGEQMNIHVDRSIYNDFVGTRSVTIYSLPELREECEGSYVRNYDARSPIEDPITLDSWVPRAHPPCVEAMVPGEYMMRTCVTIQPAMLLLSNRRTCKDSNQFTVFAANEPD